MLVGGTSAQHASGILVSEMVKALTHLGRYEIVGDLGCGAMGIVFEARDPLIGRSVAVKTHACHGDAIHAKSSCERRFLDEARCAGRLNHPNIVTIHDVGRDGGVDYIAMEFLGGRSLRELIDSGVMLDADRVADMAAQIADGLAFAHAHEVVHCDVKPDNLMVLDNGTVKITDFGVALLPSGPLANDGTAIGSPKYMSPEQVTGQQLDGRTDIFSLGAVLYEMLTGQPPFSGDNLGAILHQVVHFDPVAPSSCRSNLHPAFDVIVAKAMAKDPECRYWSAAEMASDLRSCRELGPPSTRALDASSAIVSVTGEQKNSRSGSSALPRPWRVAWVAAAAAMVLPVTLAIRLMQPTTHPPFVAESSAPSLASAAADKGNTSRARTNSAPVPMAVAAKGPGRAHKRAVDGKRKKTQALIMTKQSGINRADFSGSQNHAIARNQPKMAAELRVESTPTPETSTTLEKTVSPEQLCVDRSNFITRGFCENKICLQAEWRAHSFCAKKRDHDMRSNPMFAASN
jgi:serine/threonine-protein kinase